MIIEILKKLLGRDPDFVIGEAHDPYLYRWYLIPMNPFFNIYLHKFLRSDDDRALHDHPWASCSILLRGKYWEVVKAESSYYNDVNDVYEYLCRQPFQPVFRAATLAHRIELFRNREGKEVPVWSLFLTGRKVRSWGFHCPKGKWVPWREFITLRDGGNSVGRGCD